MLPHRGPREQAILRGHGNPQLPTGAECCFLLLPSVSCNYPPRWGTVSKGPVPALCTAAHSHLSSAKSSTPNCHPQGAYDYEDHCSSLSSPELQYSCMAEGPTGQESLASSGSDCAVCHRHIESWHFPGSPQKEGKASNHLINHGKRQIRGIGQNGQ